MFIIIYIIIKKYINKKGLEELVSGKVLKKPLKIEFDTTKNVVLFNGLEADAYDKQAYFATA